MMSNKPQSYEQQASNSLLIEQRRVDVYNATVHITYALQNQYPLVAQPQTAQAAPASFIPEQPTPEHRTVNQAVSHEVVTKVGQQLESTTPRNDHIASAQLEVAEAIQSVADPVTAINRADTHEFRLPSST